MVPDILVTANESQRWFQHASLISPLDKLEFIYASIDYTEHCIWEFLMNSSLEKIFPRCRCVDTFWPPLLCSFEETEWPFSRTVFKHCFRWSMPYKRIQNGKKSTWGLDSTTFDCTDDAILVWLVSLLPRDVTWCVTNGQTWDYSVSYHR